MNGLPPRKGASKKPFGEENTCKCHKTKSDFLDPIFIPWFNYLYFLNLPPLAPVMYWRSLSGDRHIEESNCTRGCCGKTIPKLVFNKRIHRPPKSKLKICSGNFSVFVCCVYFYRNDSFLQYLLSVLFHRKSVEENDGE